MSVRSAGTSHVESLFVQTGENAQILLVSHDHLKRNQKYWLYEKRQRETPPLGARVGKIVEQLTVV